MEEQINDAERVGDIYKSFIFEHPPATTLERAAVETIIKEELARINAFNVAAERAVKNNFMVDAESVEQTAAIWVFSGPDSWDQSFFNDQYNKYGASWTIGFDKARLMRGAKLASEIASKRGDTSLAPYLLYNGNHIQNTAVRQALAKGALVIPDNRVYIFNDPNVNTADQIETFVLPEVASGTGREIALVSHASHLARILHMIAFYDPLPRNLIPRVVPIADPPQVRHNYAAMEIRAILYYIFIAETPRASSQCAHYILR